MGRQSVTQEPGVTVETLTLGKGKPLGLVGGPHVGSQVLSPLAVTPSLLHLYLSIGLWLLGKVRPPSPELS